LSKSPRIETYQFENHGNLIHCETVGSPSSETVMIFLHGLASNATRWHELMSNLDMNEKSYLLAMDLRGHGHSMTYRKFTRQDWCNDIQALINTTNRPTILVGHSMGAQIALDYASQNQAHLQGLLLIDPVFPQALTGILKKVSRLRWLIAGVTFMLRVIHRLGIGRRQYPYRDLQELDQQTRRFLADNPDKEIADLYMDPFADLKYIPLVNYLQDQFEVTRKLPPLKKITVPVMVLLSSGASTSNVANNRKMLSTLPDLEIRTIAADHWLLTEKPDEARDIIKTWCRQKLEIS